jgi:hypothetical protein
VVNRNETGGRCRGKSDLGTDSLGSTPGASWPLRTVAGVALVGQARRSAGPVSGFNPRWGGRSCLRREQSEVHSDCGRPSPIGLSRRGGFLKGTDTVGCPDARRLGRSDALSTHHGQASGCAVGDHGRAHGKGCLGGSGRGRRRDTSERRQYETEERRLTARVPPRIFLPRSALVHALSPKALDSKGGINGAAALDSKAS